MVAKRASCTGRTSDSLNLAKIHMVAKLSKELVLKVTSLNLAKIHMVAKLIHKHRDLFLRLNLAKIHMVAKLHRS